MENNTWLFENLVSKAQEQGAREAAVIKVSDISLDPSFRLLCESNACGLYGKCWMCPPDVGDIAELIERVRTFDYALVYQTVGALEDSYDFEGMVMWKDKHAELTQKLMKAFADQPFARVLHLGAGGCHTCSVCAKAEGKPCAFPELAVSSLEAYGVNVSELAASCGMKYINGQNTVTYFGAVLFVL